MGRLKKLVPVLVILVIGFLLFQWNMTHFHLGYWLQVHTGTVNEPGPYYGFWSGFGSDLGEYAIVSSVLAGVYHAARKGNCHAHRCWRIGSLPVADGYKVCKKHHREITGAHPTVEHLTLRHAAVAARQDIAVVLGHGGHGGDTGGDSGAGGGGGSPLPDGVGGAPGGAEHPPDVPGDPDPADS